MGVRTKTDHKTYAHYDCSQYVCALLAGPVWAIPFPWIIMNKQQSDENFTKRKILRHPRYQDLFQGGCHDPI